MFRKIFFHAPIVDSKELVCSGCHIDIIRLSLGTLFVHEGIYRIVFRHCHK